MNKEKPVKAYFCPKCNSVKVGYTFGFGNLFGVMPKMKCDDCGFAMHGNFPQVVKYAKKTKKKVSKR